MQTIVYDGKEFVSAAETAKALRCSRSYIVSLTRKGMLSPQPSTLPLTLFEKDQVLGLIPFVKGKSLQDGK